MKYDLRVQYRFSIPVFALAACLLLWSGCAQPPAFREEVGPAGNEYVDPPDSNQDDSGRILTDYHQFPDSVIVIIERLVPGGKASINHWGPFRYTVTKSFASGYTNQVFVYLTGAVHQILYTEGDYKERPGRFFVAGTEQQIPLDSIPALIWDQHDRHSGGARAVKAWMAPSPAGLTYVVEIVGFRDDDTTAFAYRPDGTLKTLSEARRMRGGLKRAWTPADIEELLGGYRIKYSVDTVLNRIQTVPYAAEDGFRFIVLGDNRVHRDVWEMVAKSISNRGAVFAIDVGDLVNDGQPEEFDQDLFGILEAHGRFNFVPVVGNHDIGDDGMALSYMTAFGDNALNYYFDYGNARFVILDNCSRATNFIAQLDTADQWLASTPPGNFKFVFVHVPPGEVPKWSYHSMSGAKSQRFTELMTKHEVDHVFAGHIHAYSTASYAGVEYTITGGAGADLHDRYGPQGSVHHYVIVDVTPEGIQQQVVRFYPR